MGPMKPKIFNIWPFKKNSLLVYNSTIHFQVSAVMETAYLCVFQMVATILILVLNTWNMADVTKELNLQFSSF